VERKLTREEIPSKKQTQKKKTPRGRRKKEGGSRGGEAAALKREAIHAVGGHGETKQKKHVVIRVPVWGGGKKRVREGSRGPTTLRKPRNIKVAWVVSLKSKGCANGSMFKGGG